MLTGTLTKRGGAVTLWGDYADLSWLYELIHTVTDGDNAENEQTPESLLFGLAYEIRKARDGARKKRKYCSFGDDGQEARGVDLPLVRLVFQVIILREFMEGFGKTRESREMLARQREMRARFRSAATGIAGIKVTASEDSKEEETLAHRDFGVLCMVEGVLMDALEGAGVPDAKAYLAAARESWSHWGGTPPVQLREQIDYTHLFVTMTKASRRRVLLDLPQMLEPTGVTWRRLQNDLARVAKEKNIDPALLGISWPDVDPKL